MKNYLPFFICITVIFVILACSVPVATPVITEEPAVTLPPGPTEEPSAVLRIVYDKGGNIWLWQAGDSPRQLTFTGIDSDPQISQNGQYISFMRNGELWAIQPDGLGEQLLVSTASLASISPGDVLEINTTSWVAGNPIVTFTTRLVTEIFTIPRDDLNSTIFGGAAPDMVIPIQPDGAGGIPYTSPDLSLIAMIQPNQAILVDIDGTTNWHVALPFDTVSTYSEWTYRPQMIWKSDSSGFRILIPASDPLGDPTEPTELWDVPVSGSPSMVLSFVSVPIFEGFPSLSPDGNVAAYLQPVSGAMGIFFNSVTAGEIYYNYHTSLGLVGWSPNSSRILYWGDSPQQHFIGEAGLSEIPVGDSASVTDPGWVDNDTIIYMNGAELRLWQIGAASQLIDSGVTGGYHFVP